MLSPGSVVPASEESSEYRYLVRVFSGHRECSSQPRLMNQEMRVISQWSWDLLLSQMRVQSTPCTMS